MRYIFAKRITNNKTNGEFKIKKVLSVFYVLTEKITISDQPCATEPCQNEGKCSDIGGKVSCACLAGYYGDECEHKGTCVLFSFNQSKQNV